MAALAFAVLVSSARPPCRTRLRDRAPRAVLLSTHHTQLGDADDDWLPIDGEGDDEWDTEGGVGMDGGDDADDDMLIEDVRSEDVEDIMFRFTSDGVPKPWACKPHLRQLQEDLHASRCALVDVRPTAKWERGRIKGATHCPLSMIEGNRQGTEDALPLPADVRTPIFTYSAASDKGADAVKAAVLLRGVGYENVNALREVFEALRAQLPDLMDG